MSELTFLVEYIYCTNELLTKKHRNNFSIELSLIIRDDALKHHSIQQTNLIDNVEYFRNKLTIALSLISR